MWKCQRCGTLNVNDICSVCSSAKPEIYDQTIKTNPVTDNKLKNNNSFTGANYPKNIQGCGETPDMAEKKKSSAAIVVSLALIVVIVIVTVVIVYMKSSEKSKLSDNDTTSKKSYAEDTVYDFSDEEILSSSDTDMDEIVSDDSESDDKNNSDKNITSVDYESAEAYRLYNNYSYGFYCAYPVDFISVVPNGVNALKAYASPDMSAKMTIRACADPGTVTVESALNDFYSEYSGEVAYQANGDSWYAISVENGSDVVYRKFFMANGNLYCMDFEFEKDDLDIYSPCVEYIEDNFKIMPE